MEFVLCCLWVSFFVLGPELRPSKWPQFASQPQLLTPKPNKSSVLQDGWGTFEGRLSQYKLRVHPFLRMGGDVAAQFIFLLVSTSELNGKPPI
jgi:hypothetical protein